MALHPALKELDFFESQEIASCCDHSCKPEDTDQQKDNKEETSDLPCNPFQSCKCCVVFKTDIDFPISNPVILFRKPGTDYTENIPPHISNDFWQPPRIA